MRFRLRTNQGQSVLELADNSTVGALRAAIQQQSGVPPVQQKLLKGFPPKDLPLGKDTDLASASIDNGETLTLEELPPPPPPPVEAAPPSQFQTSETSTSGHARPSVSATSDWQGGKFVRRKIADDNSCLFNAVGYAMENHSRNEATKLRKVVADHVLANPTTWTEAYLGREPSEYARWILEPRNWGGGIELAVLADHYRTEIAGIDVQTTRMDVFGRGKRYQQRCYVLYDGIHYDALAFCVIADGPEDLDLTQFDPSDATVEEMALTVAREAKKKHEYTDLARFTLKCTDCGTALQGQKEAAFHAAQTGHGNFTEYS